MKTKQFLYSALLLGIFIFISACSKKKDNELIRDVDGNIYHSVTIGNQTWMVENLKVTHYRNGDEIPTTDPYSLDIRDQSEPKFQWPAGAYDDSVQIFGRLYTWFAVNDPRGICPKGWHVPAINEWDTLSLYLGSDEMSGGLLKDTLHWNSFNVGATNLSGFTALPTGDRGAMGNFPYFGVDNYLWSSTPDASGTTNAWGRKLSYYTAYFSTYSYAKTYGFCVRCLQDAE